MEFDKAFNKRQEQVSTTSYLHVGLGWVGLGSILGNMVIFFLTWVFLDFYCGSNNHIYSLNTALISDRESIVFLILYLLAN